MNNQRRLITSIIVCASIASALAQVKALQAPRLVVGITIDQLRSDYLEAFMPIYTDGGFKRLLSEGKVYTNVQYASSGIDRASAAASISTGTVPYNHGIIGEDWMNRATLQTIHCVDDPAWKDANGGITSSSPKNLIVSTLGDELKVATAGKALVYSIAPTRETAILTAGHAADWAMWIDDTSGNWTGSTYYGSIPSWASYLNGVNGLPNRIGNLIWKPVTEYTGTYNFYLAAYQKPFAHKYDKKSPYRPFKQSALVNEEITKAAAHSITAGMAGIDEVTDLLNICYYAGNFNGLSTSETTTELQDTYKRLDEELEKLLNTIDKLIGLDKTLIYLTSTGYETSKGTSDLARYRIPSGDFKINRCATLLNMYLVAMYGSGQYVEAYYGQQIYLNHKLLEQKQLKLAEVLEHAEDFLFQFSGVRDVFTSERITQGAWTPGISSIRNGYNPKCSGDIIIQVAPGWNLVNEDRGTSRHQRDSFFEFPLIFFGYNLKAEKLSTPVTIDCIAPTIAHHIRIRAPNACNTPPL